MPNPQRVVGEEILCIQVRRSPTGIWIAGCQGATARPLELLEVGDDVGLRCQLDHARPCRKRVLGADRPSPEEESLSGCPSTSTLNVPSIRIFRRRFTMLQG